MKMKKRFSDILLSLVMVLVMVLGLLPGMSLTALAWRGNPYADLVFSTTPVHFDGKEWYLIEDNSTAVDAGTVTLLAKECVAAAPFDLNGSTNEYSNSTIKTHVDDYYTNHISIAAKKAVDGNCMFLLTTDQAKVINENVRKCDQAYTSAGNAWWLRSPVASADEHAKVAHVWGESGDIALEGTEAWQSYGVRPALKLNLSSITFLPEYNYFHNHRFTYSASGSTITAFCRGEDEDCPLPPSQEGGSDHAVTLTIIAPTLTTYGETGKSASATLSGLDAFNTATGKSIAATDIKYVGRDDTTYAKSATAPTNAGKYTASITVGGQSASVNYEIQKADPTATVPTASATYGQTLADVTLTNPTGNTAGTWDFVDVGTTSVGNAGNHTFKANFTPKDTANYNSKNNVDVTVTVDKADSKTATVTGNERIYDGTEQPLVTVTGGATGGEMKYAVGTSTARTTGWRAAIPQATDAGVYYVWYQVPGGDNYMGTEPACEPVTISKAEPVATTPVNVTAKYGQTLGNVPLENPDGNTAGTWAWMEPARDVGNVGQRTFNAIFTPADSGNYNNKTANLTVTVEKADNPATVQPAASVKKGGNTVDLAEYVDLKGATGEVQYALIGQDKGCSLNGSVLTSGNETGTVTVNVSVRADDCHNALPAHPITVTISSRDTQKIVAFNAAITFGEKNGRIIAASDGDGKISYTVNTDSLPYITVDIDTGVLRAEKVPESGMAYVTVTAAATQTYEQATKIVTVTINKADPTVAAPTAKTLTYTGAAQKLVNAGSTDDGTLYYAVTTENTAPADNLYTESIPTATEAGSYYVWYKVAGDANHNNFGPNSVTVTINPVDATADIATCTITVKDQTYTGKALMPAVTVKDGETTLTLGTDYTVAYENNKDVGAATVTITGMGKYTGATQATFKIVKASIAKCSFTVKDRVYNGKAQKPTVTVKLGNVKLKKGTDYAVTYKNNKNVGTATVTVKGQGNFKGGKKLSFKINPKGTTFTKVTGGKQQITLKWKRQKNITGYQIQYSLKKDFSDSKSVTIKKATTLTKTIKNLKANKKYYVRIRTFKVVNGKEYISAWSKTKAIKVNGASANESAQPIETSLNVGEKLDLKTLLPDVDFESSVTWASSDEGVAMVSESGIAHATATGEAIITMTEEDGEVTSIILTVNAVAQGVDSEEVSVPEIEALILTLDDQAILTDGEGVDGEIELDSIE